MYIVKLKGGLGNQMFQYAFGRALASQTGVSVKFDLTYYRKGPPKPFLTFGLDNLNCKIREADDSDVSKCVRFGSRGRRIAESVGYQYPVVLSHLLKYHYEVQHPTMRTRFGIPQRWRFEPRVFDTARSGFFDGYWQTEKYFASITEELRREFTIKSDLVGENRRTAEKIDDRSAVALHVRRGDYVEENNALPASYFERAISEIGDTLTDPHVFVFSDDINWTKRELDIHYPETYVTHNDSETDYEDVRLMRLCDHNVISNSTFSWWGAWLNESDGQRVVAPGYWYDGQRTVDLDVVPDRWTVIETDRAR